VRVGKPIGQTSIEHGAIFKSPLTHNAIFFILLSYPKKGSMLMRAVLLFVICTACQSGRIPCPDVEYASLKKSTVHRRTFFAAPSKIEANAKTVPSEERYKRDVDLEKMKSSRTTGKQMLERYGTVEEWDCPSPSGKKRYSKAAKENIKKNEKKMRDHLRTRSAYDSAMVMPSKAVQK
jgi:hypothetical protein